MCHNFFSVPKYPENFLLLNGEKSLVKELRTLPKNSNRRKEIKKILSSLSVVKTTEQNLLILPGNGCKIRFEDNETLFCVIDGTYPVKKHILPKKSEIILASSHLGKILLGKKVGEKDKTEEGRNFIIEKILSPKKSKFIFRFSDLGLLH